MFIPTGRRGLDQTTGKPIEEEGVHYETVNTDVSPNYNGGHNWHPIGLQSEFEPGVHPCAGECFYLRARSRMGVQQKKLRHRQRMEPRYGYHPAVPTRTDSNTRAFPRGMLIAWNPALRKEVWRVPQTADWNGGVLATASDLVFQGTAEGDFVAYDGSNGKVLWKMNMGGGIIAPPVTYTIGDKQYISVAAGWGGGYGMKKKFAPIQMGRVYTFALNGKGTLPAFNQSTALTIPAANFSATSKEVKHGDELFNRYCATCHVIKEGGGLAPDLGYALLPTNAESFKAIVHGGGYLPLGMPKFGDRLSESDVEDVRKYF